MNKKRLIALGMTGIMLMSMSATAFAADGKTDTGRQGVREFTVGDETPAQGSADVDVEGMIIDSWASENSSEGTNPQDTTDPSNPTKSSSYGDPSTYGNAYLVITAPTKIRFESVGGESATLATGIGKVTNQSYYQPEESEGNLIPKTKTVKMTITAAELTASGNQFTINKGAVQSGYAGDISNLGIKVAGVKAGAGTAEYAEGKLGEYTLQEGGVASDQKTVTPSVATIEFAALTGSTTKNLFSADYSSGTPLNASSKLNLTFDYNK